jgi:hypothetical protein
LIYLLISFIFFSANAYAGSCCGGGSSSAQVMMGDTHAVFRTSYSNATVLGDSNVEANTYFRTAAETESLRTFNISYSQLFADYWQWGVATPLVSKSRFLNRQWQSDEGLGDVTFTVGYKVIPEFRRNWLLTKGYLYSSFKMANAPSLFTTTRSDLLDTRGSGHETFAIGFMGMKRNKIGITNMQVQLSYRPGKSFAGNQGIQNEDVSTDSSLDTLISLSQSLPFIWGANFDIGLSRREIANRAISTFIGEDQRALVHTTSLGLSYSYGDDYDLTFTYNDDFLVGPSLNNILTRSIAFGVVRKFNL